MLSCIVHAIKINVYHILQAINEQDATPLPVSTVDALMQLQPKYNAWKYTQVQRTWFSNLYHAQDYNYCHNYECHANCTSICHFKFPLWLTLVSPLHDMDKFLDDLLVDLRAVQLIQRAVCHVANVDFAGGSETGALQLSIILLSKLKLYLRAWNSLLELTFLHPP